MLNLRQLPYAKSVYREGKAEGKARRKGRRPCHRQGRERGDDFGGSRCLGVACAAQADLGLQRPGHTDRWLRPAASAQSVADVFDAN